MGQHGRGSFALVDSNRDYGWLTATMLLGLSFAVSRDFCIAAPSAISLGLPHGPSDRGAARTV